MIKARCKLELNNMLAAQEVPNGCKRINCAKCGESFNMQKKSSIILCKNCGKLPPHNIRQKLDPALEETTKTLRALL